MQTPHPALASCSSRSSLPRSHSSFPNPGPMASSMAPRCQGVEVQLPQFRTQRPLQPGSSCPIRPRRRPPSPAQTPEPQSDHNPHPARPSPASGRSPSRAPFLGLGVSVWPIDAEPGMITWGRTFTHRSGFATAVGTGPASRAGCCLVCPGPTLGSMLCCHLQMFAALSLNLWFVNEVQWDSGACSRAEDIHTARVSGAPGPAGHTAPRAPRAPSPHGLGRQRSRDSKQVQGTSVAPGNEEQGP